jgi:hypothetical protein
MPEKSGRGDALRKEKILLLPDNKYASGETTRRFCLSKKTWATDSQPVALSFLETPHAR